MFSTSKHDHVEDRPVEYKCSLTRNVRVGGKVKKSFFCLSFFIEACIRADNPCGLKNILKIWIQLAVWVFLLGWRTYLICPFITRLSCTVTRQSMITWEEAAAVSCQMNRCWWQALKVTLTLKTAKLWGKINYFSMELPQISTVYLCESCWPLME